MMKRGEGQRGSAAERQSALSMFMTTMFISEGASTSNSASPTWRTRLAHAFFAREGLDATCNLHGASQTATCQLPDGQTDGCQTARLTTAKCQSPDQPDLSFIP
ncbi:hypothetical protein E4U41_001253 [Claviceps citrina]|nr:hypothetical protein E4U41_001253 [Claviceps citrina]